MTKLIHRRGNIFDTDALAIGHGVNTQGVMGAGIAVQFKNRWPDMYHAYRRACLSGSFSGGQVLPWGVGEGRIVLNIASQEAPGANASYEFLFNGVSKSLPWLEAMGITTLALPRIGSGIGGLDQNIVEGLLLALAMHTPVDIELWTYEA
jgi:Predicted phosphatase homologous to the C-terminal domain of histone macroH2A1